MTPKPSMFETYGPDLALSIQDFGFANICNKTFCL